MVCVKSKIEMKISSAPTENNPNLRTFIAVML